MNQRRIDPGASIGHVHLKVADLERALRFYCDVLGFELTQRFSTGAAFISAGGYHHHIGLNTWDSLNGSPPPAGTTGLFHLAILYPTRAALGDALRRLLAADIPLDGASDHGVSEAIYYFTVLMGCETYEQTWANAFGVTFSANGTADSTASYVNVGRQPNAFVGWTKLIFLPGGADVTGYYHTEYANVVGTLFGDWMAGYSLNSCMDDFNATASLYGFTGSDGADAWKISGCYDLQKPF
jgi:catechol 2,3-dioxygenase